MKVINSSENIKVLQKDDIQPLTAASIFSTDAGWKNPSAIKAFLLDKYRGTEAERILPSVAQIVARKKAIKAAIQAEIGLDLNSEAGLI